MIAAIFAPQGLVVGRSAAVKAPSAAMDFGAVVDSKYDGIWSREAKMEAYNAWDPEKPRSYDNFNPFERNDEAQQCDVNGCFPGQGKGYVVPNCPDINWARQQAAQRHHGGAQEGAQVPDDGQARQLEPEVAGRHAGPGRLSAEAYCPPMTAR